VINNDTLLGKTTAINAQLFIYSPNQNNDEVAGYDFYPIDPNPYNALDSKTIFNGDIEIKPDKSQVVLSYDLLKSITIVSLNNLSKPLSLTFKDTPFPLFSDLKQALSTPLQYMRLYATNRYIYALYAGKTVDELEKAEGLSVHIFKWDGTAYCELHLDKFINCFCVDENNHLLYGLNPMGEENSDLYRFPLPIELFDN
jgi:hypothetical protein